MEVVLKLLTILGWIQKYINAQIFVLPQIFELPNCWYVDKFYVPQNIRKWEVWRVGN